MIFLTIVTGIAGMSQLSTVGRVFGKAMAYFLFFSTLALVVGLVVANVVQPGAGMNINPADLGSDRREGLRGQVARDDAHRFALDIIPKTLVSPLWATTSCRCCWWRCCSALALAMVGEPAARCWIFWKPHHPVFKVVGIVMKAAPLGAFGAMAFTIVKFGLGRS